MQVDVDEVDASVPAADAKAPDVLSDAAVDAMPDAGGTADAIGAPDTGGGGGFRVQVVFTGTIEDESRRLYGVDLDQPGTIRDLSGELGPGFVDSFMMDPTGRSVAFRANAADAEKFELYRVDFADLETGPVRLNDDLPPGGDVDSAGKRRGTGAGFRFSPDGQYVYYVARQDESILGRDLWRVPVAQPGSGQSQRVNEAFVVSGQVGRFGFEQDGSSLIYLADQDGPQASQIYRVDTAQPGDAIRLNDDLVERGDVESWQTSGDGAVVVYKASQEFVGRNKLWAVREPNVGSGNSFQVSDGDLSAGGVALFETVPGTDEVVYSVGTGTRRSELFRVELDVPAIATRLNGTLVDGGSVFNDGAAFRVTPDGSRVVYVADEEVDERFELYAVDITDLGRRKLSDPAQGNRVDDLFRFSPNGEMVAFVVNDGSQDRLLLVDLDAGAPQEVSHDLGAGSTINDFEFTSDGSRMIYQVRSGTDRTRILFMVEIAEPGVETLLHPPSVDGGRIWEFDVVP